MRCFICLSNVFARGKRCHACRALMPVVSRMERVYIERDGTDAASILKHQPVVPFWESETDWKSLPACTVVEVKAYAVKVQLVIQESGEVLVSAKPAHMPVSSVVAKRLL